MLEKYKVIDSTVTTFITITVVEWFDLQAGRQAGLLVRPIYCFIPTAARNDTSVATDKVNSTKSILSCKISLNKKYAIVDEHNKCWCT